MRKFTTVKKVVSGGLLLVAMSATVLSGTALPGQNGDTGSGTGGGGVTKAYAACDGQPPGPDLDCPNQPTATPSPTPDEH